LAIKEAYCRQKSEVGKKGEDTTLIDAKDKLITGHCRDFNEIGLLYHMAKLA